MVPATGRESDASRVCFKENEKIKWINPGAWRSISGETAYTKGQASDRRTSKGGDIQYLWCHVSLAEACTACCDDEVYWI